MILLIDLEGVLSGSYRRKRHHTILMVPMVVES